MTTDERESNDGAAETNMTSMIDVTFLLLIFFIVTMKFRVLEQRLDSHLPTDFGPAPTSVVDEMKVTVGLRQDPGDERPLLERRTRYYFERERIDAGGEGAARDLVAQRLRAFVQRHPEAKGIIDTGPGVPHAKVVAVLDLLHAAGYRTITFGGLPASRGVPEMPPELR